MTTVLASQADLATPEPKPVSLAVLTTVELRKMVNTRAGAVLLALVGAVAVAMTVVRMFAGEAGDRTMTGFLTFAVLPVSIVLPIIGVLAVTSEWSQRTALATFSLVPRRSLVALAKLAAVLVLSLITVAGSVLLAAVGNGIAPLIGDADGSWELTGTSLLNITLYHATSLLIGFAFGMVTMNSVMGIVVYFALPAVWSILRNLVSGVDDAAAWLDMNETLSPLSGTAALSGEDWVKVGIAVLIWGLVPTVAGLIRLSKIEIK